MDTGDMERGEFIRKLEDAIQQAALGMEKAQRQNDMARLESQEATPIVSLCVLVMEGRTQCLH